MINNKIKSDCSLCESQPPLPSLTPTPSVTKTPTITPTISITQTVTITPSVSITNSSTPTTTPTITVTKSNSISPTPTLSNTITPTRTPTITVPPNNYITSTPTNTPSYSKSNNNIHLFNKNSWSSIIPEPYKTYFNQSADRWNSYIKYNSSVRSQIPNLYPGWNGLALRTGGYTEINDSTSNVVASCGPYNFVDINGGPMPTWMNSVNFSITINKSWENYFSSNDWINIITHELGHALGIGIFWQVELQPYGAVPPVDFFLNGSVYTNTQQGYNIVSEFSRIKVPLENIGSTGTASAHWENDYRPASAQGSGGVDYVGVTDELMVGTIGPNNRRVISVLSINNLLDYGYEEVNPGTSEGTPTLQQSLTMGVQGLKLNCCEYYSHKTMEKLGTIYI
jgi:hypothetical protein